MKPVFSCAYNQHEYFSSFTTSSRFSSFANLIHLSHLSALLEFEFATHTLDYKLHVIGRIMTPKESSPNPQNL